MTQQFHSYTATQNKLLQHLRDKKDHGSIAYRARTLETIQMSINKLKNKTCNEMNEPQLHVIVWMNLS